MRRRRPEKRGILPDPVYNDVIVAKFINNLMSKGKKSLAEKIFYKCIEKIKNAIQHATDVIAGTSKGISKDSIIVKAELKNIPNLKPTPLLLPSNSTTKTIFHINARPDLADAIKYG